MQKGGYIMNIELDEMMQRKEAVDNALGVLLTAAKLPNNNYLNALDEFIAGKITIDELDEKVHSLVYVYGE